MRRPAISLSPPWFNADAAPEWLDDVLREHRDLGAIVAYRPVLFPFLMVLLSDGRQASVEAVDPGDYLRPWNGEGTPHGIVHIIRYLDDDDAPERDGNLLTEALGGAVPFYGGRVQRGPPLKMERMDLVSAYPKELQST